MTSKLREKYHGFLIALTGEAESFQKGKIPLHIFNSEELELLTKTYKRLIEENQKPSITFEIKSHLLGNVIMRRLIQATKNGNSFQDAIETVYDELENSTNIETQSNRAWSYLYEFESNLVEIELDNSVIIRKMNFLEHLNCETENEQGMASLKVDYVIETKPNILFSGDTINEAGMCIDIGEEKYWVREDIKSEFYDVLAILRLVYPSNIGIMRINFEFGDKSDSQETVGISVGPPSQLHPGTFGSFLDNVCHISQSGIDFAKRLLHQLEEKRKNWSKKQRDKWHQALRRYNNALTSNYPEDAIVDLIIGLEIIFRAIGFKMIFLCSNLIEMNLTDRKIVVETLESAYKIRNRIVHGGSIKDDDIVIVKKTVGIVAKVLIFIVALNWNEDIIDVVNSSLYNLEKTQKLREYLSDWISPKSDCLDRNS